jgi:6-phosphogluconolactonase
MFVPKQLALTVGSLALILGGSMTADAHDNASNTPVVGHLYANDNTAGMNTIGAFDRHADGTLTPTPGSPFQAGGAGTGQALGSQGSLQLAGGGRFLLAADAGSNQISVLRIRDDGGLTPVNGSPVLSNGTEPISIAVHDDLVYVANEGDGSMGSSNYTGFRLRDDGHLTAIAGSTIALSGAALPGDILFNSTGKNLVAPEVGPSLIDSFSVGSGGLLTRAPGPPFAAQGVGPFGSEFRPTNPSESQRST